MHLKIYTALTFLYDLGNIEYIYCHEVKGSVKYLEIEN